MIVILAALVTALALASLAVSVYTLLSAHKLIHSAKIIAAAVRAECAAMVETAQSQRQAAAPRFETAPPQTQPEIVPGVPKPGMNLSRRSHALRLYRKGGTPEYIAASLAVPRQEIDLLIKVHEIGLNNL